MRFVLLAVLACGVCSADPTISVLNWSSNSPLRQAQCQGGPFCGAGPTRIEFWIYNDSPKAGDYYVLQVQYRDQQGQSHIAYPEGPGTGLNTHLLIKDVDASSIDSAVLLPPEEIKIIPLLRRR